MFFGAFSSNLHFREKFSQKPFAKNSRNFAKINTLFVKVFVFAKGQKSVFVPTLGGSYLRLWPRNTGGKTLLPK
jgi:hypothetical protein